MTPAPSAGTVGPGPAHAGARPLLVRARALLARAIAAIEPAAWGPAGPVTVAWVLTMLAIPFVEWFLGVPGRTAAVAFAVLLQAAAVVLLLARSAGLRATAWMAGSVVVVAWAAEALGSATGVPFGDYGYTDLLQPQLAGVPLLIPLAWLMLLPTAWAVGARITGRSSGPAFVAVSALAMTAWDLFLDPQMVAWGLWSWDEPGPYFGIPLVNFGGWLLVAAIATVVARPTRLPLRPLVVLYTLTWMIEASGLAIFWGLAGPALVGLVAMGALVVAAWRARGPWT